MKLLKGRALCGIALFFAAASVAVAQDDVENSGSDALPDPIKAESTLEPTPATSVDREIDSELERIQLALERSDAFVASMEQAGINLKTSTNATRERIAELTVALRDVDPASEQADRLYETAVAELETARTLLAAALDEWKSPSGLQIYSPVFQLDSVNVDRFLERIARGRELMAALRVNEANGRSLESALKWEAVENHGRHVEILNGLRISSLKTLTPLKHQRVLGISRDGIGQLDREVGHALLMARLYRETRLKQIQEARVLTRDLFVIGSLTYAIFRLALVIASVLMVRSRWRDWIDRLRRAMFRRARSVARKRRNDAWLDLLRSVAPWILYLVAVVAVRWALNPAVAIPEFDVIYQIAMIYGIYRLAIEALVALVIRIGRHYRLRIAASRQAKLLTTVRWVMRIATPIAALLVVSSRVLGRGYLYHLVAMFSWLIAGMTLIAIIVSWRHVAAEAFLEVQPTGRLARMVRSSSGRWYGVLITPACFVWMAGRAMLAITRDFALGFEQTRRGLAFIFLRRIEKQAEVRGYAEVELETLAPAVLDAFSEEAVPPGPLAVDYFPGLEEFSGTLSAWRERGAGGSFLLTGERGSGKTTWLGQVTADDLPKAVVSLHSRPSDGNELASALGAAIFPDADRLWTLDDLQTDLETGPRRMVVVDLAQHLFLATVGGYEVFDAFANLVERTQRSVFWLCAMSGLAWQRLQAVRSTKLVFRHHQVLEGWSEEKVRELIRTRVAAAGIRPNYSDLVVDRMEGVSTQARLIESEEGYTRLLWDYSDGNPRVALHFYLRSLVPESADSARVRLFKGPPVDVLGQFDEACLFTLSAVVTHENTTLGETSVVTGYPEQLCRIHLDRLLELGALKIDDERYRITTYWHRAAIRLLRRRSLLMD